MSKPIESVEGALLDLDGVFYVGSELIPGALETLDYLTGNAIPYCFITNTSTKSASQLLQQLQSIGLPATADQLITAPKATCEYLRQKKYTHCQLVIAENCLEDFPGIRHTTQQPQAVVIGDIGDAWDYPLLNSIFRSVINGAELVAMHKNKYWQTESGLQMDIGAFVAGIEYVTGQPAVVTGKPARPFFDAALASIDCKNRSNCLLVGDDIVSDIGAAQQAGIYGVLVRTGKYREELVSQSTIAADAVIDSIADLASLIDNR